MLPMTRTSLVLVSPPSTIKNTVIYNDILINLPINNDNLRRTSIQIVEIHVPEKETRPSYIEWVSADREEPFQENFKLVTIQQNTYLINYDNRVYNYKTRDKEYIGIYHKPTNQIIVEK